MSVVWPTLRAGLLTLLPTLPGWSGVLVTDGPPLSGDTGTYCAVGYVEDEQGAGTFTQTPDDSGFFDVETGEVRSELYTGNGDGDLAAAVNAGFTLVNALQAAMKTDRTLGCLPQGSTCSVRGDVITGRAEGAGQLLVLSVSYLSPIT